jgi:hypothetical protein
MVTDKESVFLQGLARVAEDYLQITTANAVADGRTPADLRTS